MSWLESLREKAEKEIARRLDPSPRMMDDVLNSAEYRTECKPQRILALLEVCEAAEKLVTPWNIPDCDCEGMGHSCGWPRVIAVKDALTNLEGMEDGRT